MEYRAKFRLLASLEAEIQHAGGLETATQLFGGRGGWGVGGLAHSYWGGGGDSSTEF